MVPPSTLIVSGDAMSTRTSNSISTARATSSQVWVWRGGLSGPSRSHVECDTAFLRSSGSFPK